MNKKKKSSVNKHSEGRSKKHRDENPDKKKSNPDDSSEEKRPRIREMPVTGGPNHPHNEEILDGIP